jgi:Caspase domain
MPNRLYALHVGINAYTAPVRALQGCLPDVERLQGWLRGSFDPAALALETLSDAQATRANVIDAFRRHLGQAGPGDVALFHFSGHGAQSASAAAFRPFFPEGLDEGLVCADSRLPGGHDLADKELAALLHELAPRQSHVAVLFDCCHSGSGTRSADAFGGLVPRMTGAVSAERPLESYLDGHYARMLAAGQPLAIPSVRHILLAACERGQLAQEQLSGPGAEPGGIFTSTLLEVLKASGGELSYADLFVRCRAVVRKRARDQTPQFEAAARFDARSGFLGRTIRRQGRRFSVHFEKGAWQAACGAIHGLPVDSTQPVALTLYPEGASSRSAGTATAVQIGAQHSVLALDFDSPGGTRYEAEISSLPVPPMLLGFDGSSAQRDAVQQALDEDLSAPVQLVAADAGAAYTLALTPQRLALQRAGEGSANAGLAALTLAWSGLPTPADAAALGGAAQDLQPTLQAVQRWERLRTLANPRTRMDLSLVDFEISEPQPDGSSFVHPGREITLTSTRDGADWRPCRLRLRVRNRSPQPLHFLLLNLSPQWGIHRLVNEPLAARSDWMTLFGEAPEDFLFVDEGLDEVIERFQLVVATEPMDDFLLTQDNLAPDADVTRSARGLSRGVGSVSARQVHKNEWFTLPCQVRLVRQLGHVGAADAVVAQGKITVRRHSRVRAELTLGAARTNATRSLGPALDFYQAIEARGLQMLDFAGGSRSDADQSVLTLTNLTGAEALADEPLEIVVDVPLAADEGLLPLVYDGQHVSLGGAASRQDDGSTLISISHLPDDETQGRSLGGALKMYFFKTVLRRDNVNRLRWVGWDADGQPQQHDDGVAAKVAAARRVLLLVHGIIGDTAGIAAGLRDIGLDQRFDLVLSYDYENLDTPIEATARRLGQALHDVGLHEGDDKQLTLLVHSMGGLVSRWFIEREGGAALVDHLVMCGTPNGGSPFGRIDDARKIFSVLTSLTLNYIPVLIPFASATLLLLNRSKVLTKTLEQMHPDSPFIQGLNSSPDPGVRYTIVAGDVNVYEEPSDALFARLLAKVGQSTAFDLLFARKPNDIAVAVPSILSAGAGRAQPPRRFEVACHHMNYFVSPAGQAALRAVAWD